MNQKKAKKLRDAARTATAGLPNVKYIKGQPPVFRADYDQSGMVLGYSKIALGAPTKMDKNCTRYAYKQMKRAA